MLSPKQITNISILSMCIASIATVLAPPAASTFLVLASSFTISAISLSLMTSIANIMSGNHFNEWTKNPKAEVSSDRQPAHTVHIDATPTVAHAVHHNPATTTVHVVHHKPAPKTVHVIHNNQAPTTIHGVQYHAPKAVRHSAIKKTATDTKIPSSASHIQRTVTTTPRTRKTHAQRRTVTGTRQQTTATGTIIPNSATNIKRERQTGSRTVTTTPIIADAQRTSTQQKGNFRGKPIPVERKHGQSFIGNNVLLAGKRVITPQADGLRTKSVRHNRPSQAHTDDTSKLSGKVVIRQRKI